VAKILPRIRARMRRKMSIRNKVRGSAERPRLSIYCSGRHVYAQLVDDDCGHTLAAASTMGKDVRDTEKCSSNIAAAKKVGTAISEMAKARKISSVVFDRNGYLFHGKVKALADAARKGGLRF